MDAPPGPRKPSRTEPRERSARPDPFAAILSLGRHSVRVGLAIGIAGALMVHGAAAAKGMTTLVYLSRFAAMVQSDVAERMRATYDVDFKPPPEVSTPEEPEPEEKEPEKVQPKPEAPKDEKVSDNPYDDPAPEAAEAGKVLTAEPDPDAPLDLTGNSFITGSGDRYAGGTTASGGTSKTAVGDRRAKAGGQKGGTGTKPGPAGGGTAAADRSRPAGLVGGGNWNDCGFPAAADMEQIDYAVVTIAVTVDASGRAKNVSVLSDPGYGFGALARSCAFRKSYTPGYDKAGQPVAKTTPPIRVRFTR